MIYQVFFLSRKTLAVLLHFQGGNFPHTDGTSNMLCPQFCRQACALAALYVVVLVYIYCRVVRRSKYVYVRACEQPYITL